MGPRTILAGGTSQRCDQNLQGHGAGLCGCFTAFDEGYINGAVKALAEVIKIYGISLNDSCLQDEADSLNLSLGELRERLDAKLKEMEHPEEK